jgi:hypothetical protein
MPGYSSLGVPLSVPGLVYLPWHSRSSVHWKESACRRPYRSETTVIVAWFDFPDFPAEVPGFSAYYFLYYMYVQSSHRFFSFTKAKLQFARKEKTPEFVFNIRLDNIILLKYDLFSSSLF